MPNLLYFDIEVYGITEIVVWFTVLNYHSMQDMHDEDYTHCFTAKTADSTLTDIKAKKKKTNILYKINSVKSGI